MKTMKSLLAFLLIGFVSITASTASFAVDDTVQFTLEVVADDQITLNAVTQVTKGLNAIEALNQVVAMGIKDTDWGPQIMSLGGVEAVGNTYWALWVNGEMSMVGAQDVILDADTVISLILTEF
ncbi:MAG: DUF4430 domain-containing protein [Gammaproteobacteria bacterium]|nr:DUF4430 domain-containing protein [Gammaproteobacteria bacterium]